MISERSGNGVSGWLVLPILLAAMGYAIYREAAAGDLHGAFELEYIPVVLVGVAVVVVLLLPGFFIVQPNQPRVLQFFGHYVGTVRKHGLRWTIPLFTKAPISIRVHSFETQQIKVNDKQGNPIVAAAIVVWRVVDTAKASFEVADYAGYVATQSEAALRSMVMNYPYESYREGEVAHASHTAEVSEQLCAQSQERLIRGGVEVIEARISHLSYASEIAAAMLQRQQAGAIVAARQKIVEGAVGMVEHALQMLTERNIVTLDNERRAQMVANLLVVLCSERHAQPVLDTSDSHRDR